MKQQLRKAIKLASAASLIAVAAGCATTQELESLRQQLDEVQQTANSASDSANRAQSDAAEALTAAQSAQSAADEAAACCVASNERMDRMFNELQRK
jgi:Alanine-zipper, major outer membrane lipoprotein